MPGLTTTEVSRLGEAARWRDQRGNAGCFLSAAFLIIIAVACFALAVFYGFRRGFTTSTAQLVSWIALPVSFAAGLSSLRSWAKALREDPVTMEAHLEHRLCPACTYPLAAIPTGPDGFRTCPECSAAWHLPEPPSS